MPRSGCRTVITNVIFLVLVVWAFAAGFRGEPKDLGRPFASLTGPRSAIGEPIFVRVRDAEEWEKLWHRHTDGKAEGEWIGRDAVEIDWSRCMVIGVFRGMSHNSNGERLASLLDRGQDIVVRYDSMSYQTASGFGDVEDKGVDVTPYGLFLVARSDKPLVFEDNVQGLIGHPPVWKETFRLPAVR